MCSVEYLVVHGPATVDELELTLLHELDDAIVHRRGLLQPPADEESNLDVDELAIGILRTAPSERPSQYAPKRHI
jgi:hypothetical protein